jgi:hypothetical protein
VDGLTALVADAPQNGSTEVAERGALPAPQYGGHEAAVTSKRQVSHGVHATVNTVHPPPPKTPIDRVFAQSQVHELSPANHAVLPLSKVRNRPVEGVLRNLTAHYAGKRWNPRIHPLNAPRSAHRARRRL